MKSGDNDGDSFAKNLGGELCGCHSGKMTVQKGSEEQIWNLEFLG